MNYCITDGEDMAAYFAANRPDCGNVIPFNEKLDLGNPKEDILSGMYIVERLSALHTTITNYQNSVLKYVDFFCEPAEHSYHLYFMPSRTSDINILSILAYLDRAGYKKPVDLTFVSSDYRDISTKSVNIAGMFDRYREYCRSGQDDAHNFDAVHQLLEQF